MKKIVITGPTGALGIALIRQCIREQIEVYALCRKNSARIGRIPADPHVHVIPCDLSEMETFTQENLAALSGQSPEEIGEIDAFYHFGWAATIGAGRNDMPLQIQNIRYTIDAVRLAARLRCRVFLGAGSQAEYGRVEGQLNAKVPVSPENGYGMAKLCAGQMGRVEAEKVGIRFIWTRILSLYGPYDGEATMITSTIRKLLAGEVPPLTEGKQMWDYLFSSDAARAFLLLGEKGLHGKTYCIGSGTARPLREYIEIMRDQINPEAALGFGEIPYGPKQVMYLCADISELSKDTGFEPVTDFREGIRETIHWVKTGTV